MSLIKPRSRALGPEEGLQGHQAQCACGAPQSAMTVMLHAARCCKQHDSQASALAACHSARLPPAGLGGGRHLCP